VDESRTFLTISGVKESTAAAIASEAAGHPLYLRELSRAASGVEQPPALQSFTLNGLLEQRVRALAPAQRQLLELVSLAGRSLPETLFRNALAAADSSDGDVVERLEQNHLIRVS